MSGKQRAMDDDEMTVATNADSRWRAGAIRQAQQNAAQHQIAASRAAAAARKGEAKRKAEAMTEEERKEKEAAHKKSEAARKRQAREDKYTRILIQDLTHVGTNQDELRPALAVRRADAARAGRTTRQREGGAHLLRGAVPHRGRVHVR